MKRACFYFVFVYLLGITACQHELQWDIPATGTLLKDVNGNCLPVTVAGSYTRNKVINDSNFIIVNVDATGKGPYTINTDSLNGYSFKATGVFNTIGIIAVKLAGKGKPFGAGTDHFTLHFNSSICEAGVSVQSDSIVAANYTLQGSPGVCMNDSVMGNYLQSVALDTSDRIIISVNVITPGSYSIVTPVVNGYNFSGAGVFTTAGLQQITLAGNGTPLAAGSNLFAITAGASKCSFSVNVVPVATGFGQYYFPLTKTSYWTYNEVGSTDTVTRNITAADTTVDSMPYTRMNELNRYNTSQYLFNLYNSAYTEYARVDKYTNSFQYNDNVYGFLPFLKEHLFTNQTWESDEFGGTASFGQLIYMKYLYTCLNNDATIVLNGQGFAHVYVVAMYPQIRSQNNAYGYTGEQYTYYYAKGVGLIYFQESLNGALQYILQIKNWHVN